MAKTVCHLGRSRSTQQRITALRAFSSQLSFGNNMLGIKTKTTLRNYPSGQRFSPLYFLKICKVLHYIPVAKFCPIKILRMYNYIIEQQKRLFSLSHTEIFVHITT